MWASILWILLSVTACLCSPIADLVPATKITDAAALQARDRNASWWRAKETHYLRMPINRHVFNGTGRRPHRKGPHVESPVNRRWGWEHLEDLGGIAYIIQRVLTRRPLSKMCDSDNKLDSRYRNTAAVGQGLHRHRLLRVMGKPKV